MSRLQLADGGSFVGRFTPARTSSFDLLAMARAENSLFQ